MAGFDQQAFSSDRKTHDAAIRNLEIIGEASRNLPPHLISSAPEIEWRKIIGLRNILIHEYSGVSLPIVWDVVQTKLDPLARVCRTLLGSEDP